MSSRITSSDVPLQASLPPQSVAAAGNATSGWLDASKGAGFLTTVLGGALGGGSVALTFEQAQDASGTGAKALSGVNVGAGLAANNDKFTVDNVVEKLDHNNGFTFVRAKLTVTGGTGALVAAALHTTSPRYLS